MICVNQSIRIYWILLKTMLAFLADQLWRFDMNEKFFSSILDTVKMYPGKSAGLFLLLVIFGFGLGALAVNLAAKAV